MLTLQKKNQIEEEVKIFNDTLETYNPQTVAFSVDVELNEYDESPKYGVVAKTKNGVLYQFETDDQELAEEIRNKIS